MKWKYKLNLINKQYIVIKINTPFSILNVGFIRINLSNCDSLLSTTIVAVTNNTTIYSSILKILNLDEDISSDVISVL